MSCPDDNSALGVDDCFFCSDGIHWDAHRIGWAVAGGCAALTALITLSTLTMHARNYQQPRVQRQVMRVLLMPAIYAIVSFFSYRYYTEYEYYVLAETAYEAITLSAFLMLLMELVALGTRDQDIKEVLLEKDKRKLPFPFNFWRFRASKPYFMHTLSFSVMQYVIIRPLISIVGIICEYYNVLCVQKYSVHFAEVYLEAVDFVSISIALYGLIVFYVLCKDELKGRRPLNKFLAIKLIVFFTFYQSFVFSILQNYNVIKGTALWTADNVKNGLSALCTCVEMVFFSIYMGWAYSWTDYTNKEMNPNQRPTGWKTYFQAIWDTINLSDFAVEIYLAVKFFWDFLRGEPHTRAQPTRMQQTFMPDTIHPEHKLPMTQLGTNPDRPSGQQRRTSSADILDTGMSPDYYRLQDRNTHTNTNTDSSSQAATGYPPVSDPKAPAFPSPRPTWQPQHPPVSATSGTYNLSPVGHTSFPSARPTGAAGQWPRSAHSGASAYTPTSGESHYATPTQWNGGEEDPRTQWPQAHPSDYRNAERGIEGNPRLY